MSVERKELKSALWDVIASQGFEITPEQEEELAALEVGDFGDALFELDMAMTRLEEIKKRVKKYMEIVEAQDSFVRARATKKMVALDPDKPIRGEDGNWTLGLQAGRGRIELAPGFTLDDLNPVYLIPETTWRLDSDLARKDIEAGSFEETVEMGKTFIHAPEVPGVRIVKEPFVVLRKTQRGKLTQFTREVERGITPGELADRGLLP